MPLRRLLKPRPNFSVSVAKQVVARSLWDYGEDDLAQRALTMSDQEHRQVVTISGWYELPNYPLPLEGERITHGHVNAFAAITLFEGSLRPLARARRRPAKECPLVFLT